MTDAVEIQEPPREVEIVWKDQSYTLRYDFGVVKRIRDAGVSVPNLFSAIVADNAQTVERADEIATAISVLLRQAGADASPEDVWRETLSKQEFAQTAFALFMWIATVHFYTSPNLPEKKNPVKL